MALVAGQKLPPEPVDANGHKHSIDVDRLPAYLAGDTVRCTVCGDYFDKESQ